MRAASFGCQELGERRASPWKSPSVCAPGSAVCWDSTRRVLWGVHGLQAASGGFVLQVTQMKARLGFRDEGYPVDATCRGYCSLSDLLCLASLFGASLLLPCY